VAAKPKLVQISSKYGLPRDDGVAMDLQVANLWEVRRWLFGWEKDAEIMIPENINGGKDG
jgi:hypothetical protein